MIKIRTSYVLDNPGARNWFLIIGRLVLHVRWLPKDMGRSR